MRKTLSLLTFCALAVGLFVTAGSADEKDEKARSYENKLEATKNPLTVDFAAELDLSFDCLKDLGVRISRARNGVDPVGLTVAGNELAMAEKVSGKTASIKSADLIKEGVAAARRRHNSRELKAVALIVSDEKVKEDLEKQAVKAAKNEKLAEKGELKRGIGQVRVVNRSKHLIHIYINDQNLGHIHPNKYRDFSVENGEDDTTKLYAHSAGGAGRHAGPISVSQNYRNYTWTVTGQ